MKNISELGLELIELEDQVLLVDNLNPKVGGYLVDNDQIYGPFDSNDPLIDYRGNIIASTKPIEGLPLLVIEDESELLASQEYGFNSSSEAFKNWKRGYNKAKETYKFTEEDMGDLIEICIGLQEEWRLIKQIDAIQRFNKTHKKELWIDVEAHCIACDKYYNKSNRCKQVKGETSICYLRLDSIPKIVNNQIKATYR